MQLTTALLVTLATLATMACTYVVAAARHRAAQVAAARAVGTRTTWLVATNTGTLVLRAAGGQLVFARTAATGPAYVAQGTARTLAPVVAVAATVRGKAVA